MESKKFKMPKAEYLFIFFILVYSMTFFGTGTSLFGLSIDELAKNLGVSRTQVSYFLSISSVCSIFGSLTAVLTLDKFNRQLQLGILFTILSISFMIIPILRSFVAFLICGGIQGFLTSSQQIIPNVWMVEIFGSASKTYLQILHTFFPIGQMLGPMIYIPFVSQNDSNQISNNSIITNGLVDDILETTKRSQLWIPYTIVGLCEASAGLMVLIAYCVKPYRKPKRTKEKFATNNQDANEDIRESCLTSKYRLFFVLVISSVTAIQLTTELMAMTYISTYMQISNLKLEKITAAYCQGVLSTATTVGRIVNIFLTLKIRSHTMLFINFILIISGNIVLLTIGYYTIQGAYLGAGLVGYGFSSTFPMLIAYTDKRIVLSNKVMSCMSLMTAILTTLFPSFYGYLLDTKPLYFIVLNLCMSSFAFFLYITLVICEKLRTNKVFS